MFGKQFKAHGSDDFDAEERDMIEQCKPLVFGKTWESDDEDEDEDN
jgi:hypothetical protein